MVAVSLLFDYAAVIAYRLALARAFASLPKVADICAIPIQSSSGSGGERVVSLGVV
jgi:hypothetical protein